MATERAGQPVDAAVATMAFGQGVGGVRSSVPQTQPSITVDHANVLRAAKIIQDVLDGEGASILGQLGGLQVIPPGADPVSQQAAKAWNDRLVGAPDSYSVRVQQYLQSLQTLVTNLKTSAKQYGYSEQQISDAFTHGR